MARKVGVSPFTSAAELSGQLRPREPHESRASVHIVVRQFGREELIEEFLHFAG
jgi:hypothetical protein